MKNRFLLAVAGDRDAGAGQLLRATGSAGAVEACHQRARHRAAAARLGVINSDIFECWRQIANDNFWQPAWRAGVAVGFKASDGRRARHAPGAGGWPRENSAAIGREGCVGGGGDGFAAGRLGGLEGDRQGGGVLELAEAADKDQPGRCSGICSHTMEPAGRKNSWSK